MDTLRITGHDAAVTAAAPQNLVGFSTFGMADNTPIPGKTVYVQSEGIKTQGINPVHDLCANANVEKIMTYITVTFHTYIRQTITPLNEHWQRVAEVYGGTYPELRTITAIFHQMRSEILSYIHFKERVLYPLIKELYDREGIRHTWSKELHWRLDRALSHGETMDLSIGTDLQTIQSLSDNFSAPAESARFCELSHQEMKIFVEQWQRHSHNEIHVLHPKVRGYMRRFA